MTVDQYLITAIASLSAAVVAVWRKGDVAERRCDEDRKLLWEAIKEQNSRSCKVANCDLREQDIMPNIVLKKG